MGHPSRAESPLAPGHRSLVRRAVPRRMNNERELAFVSASRRALPARPATHAAMALIAMQSLLSLLARVTTRAGPGARLTLAPRPLAPRNPPPQLSTRQTLALRATLCLFGQALILNRQESAPSLPASSCRGTPCGCPCSMRPESVEGCSRIIPTCQICAGPLIEDSSPCPPCICQRDPSIFRICSGDRA